MKWIDWSDQTDWSTDLSDQREFIWYINQIYLILLDSNLKFHSFTARIIEQELCQIYPLILIIDCPGTWYRYNDGRPVVFYHSVIDRSRLGMWCTCKWLIDSIGKIIWFEDQFNQISVNSRIIHWSPLTIDSSDN